MDRVGLPCDITVSREAKLLTHMVVACVCAALWMYGALYVQGGGV